MSIVLQDIATSAGHWYKADGSPAYTIQGNTGERAVTLRDARKLNLYPSVSAILKVAAAPGLDQWKQKQILLSALTLPRQPDEPTDDFASRVLRDSQEQGKRAREAGEALHGAIERYAQGKTFDQKWEDHVAAVEYHMGIIGLSLKAGHSEHSFAHDGYGGKVDWHNHLAVVDFKSKPNIQDTSKLAYAEHVMQLSAYRNGLKLPFAKLYNIFVGIEDRKVHVHEWPEEEAVKGLEKFKCLLRFWQLDKGYAPQA